MKQKLIFFILGYLKFFAKIQLLKNQPTIIGITGSAGKTSTRDAVFAVLKDKKKVKVSYKSNSETGIPLNILGLTPKNFSLFDWLRLMLLAPIKIFTNWEQYDTYIVEMGIDSPDAPKNMEYLLTIVKPDIGIMLNAAPMHSEPFDYLIKTTNKKERAKAVTKLIANEKGKIVTKLSNKKTAILNIDQEELVNLQPQIKAQLFTFGENSLSDIKIIGYKIKNTNTEFTYKINSKTQTLTFKNQLLPEHFGHTFAAAIAVGKSLYLQPNEIKNNLENNFKLPPGRSSFIAGINDSKIIDSSYNSSTKPALDMLDLLKTVPGKRKFSILGDIRELGEVAQTEHEIVAKKAAEVCDGVLLVGPQMKKFALPKIQNSKTQVHWFKNGLLAAEFLKSELKKDDIVLVKGSQNTLLLEIAVEALMKHPEQAEKLLARRGEFWDKKREEINEQN